jgi:hypothetical protein
LAAALENHADAGQELAHVDGLGDEIVGSDFKPGQKSRSIRLTARHLCIRMHASSSKCVYRNV